MVVINLNQFKEGKDLTEAEYLSFLPVWNNYWDKIPKPTPEVILSQAYISLRLAHSAITFISVLGMLGEKGKETIKAYLYSMAEEI